MCVHVVCGVVWCDVVWYGMVCLRLCTFVSDTLNPLSSPLCHTPQLSLSTHFLPTSQQVAGVGAGGLEAKTQDLRAEAMAWQGPTSRAGKKVPSSIPTTLPRLIAH